MNKKEFTNFLYFYQQKAYYTLECVFYNNSICNWYEKYRSEFARIRNFSATIANSLMNEFYINLSKLFDDRSKDSLCIQSFSNLILSNKIINKETHKKLKLIAKEIIIQIQETFNQLNEVHNWRDKYLAHFDKKILSNNLLNLQEGTYKALIKLLNFTFENLNKIIVIIGDSEITRYTDIVDDTGNVFFYYILGLRCGHKQINRDELLNIPFPKS